MKRILTTFFVAALLPLCCNANSSWAPAGEHIRTRWAAEVTPSNAHTEYPRPQMVRGKWRSLNGLWNYAKTQSDAAQMPSAPDGQILVPFPFESSLSGVAGTLSAQEALWYERSFRVPFFWRLKKDIILHFDAVDWKCEVWLNGQRVGEHQGGYTAFEFNVTPYLKRGRQTLTLKVLDATDNGLQPRGKQVSNPGGIWYTPVSGIWQSVWFEPVQRQGRICDYQVGSDLSKSIIEVKPVTDGGDELLVELLEGGVGYRAGESAGKVIQKVLMPVGATAVLPVDEPQLWSPDEPYLYGLRITLLQNGKKIDCVHAYTAMREIGKVRDSEGHLRMALNGEPLFQYGPLDQGWWPDGLYTAPTLEALEYDLVRTKDFGFNMIRKHIKVEPSTWYAACDRLGILVWQDMPCNASYEKREWWSQGADVYDAGFSDQLTPEGRENFIAEWRDILAQLGKFQSIVVWVPFNEGWGQFETAETVQITRELGGRRLVNMASGGNWISGGIGDILDSHHYPNPKMRIWDPDLVNVLGEYGGIGLPVEGHTWVSDKNWGYVELSTSEEVTAKYEEFAAQIIPLVQQGCSAAIYTQTTDVERELNGLMTYDRAVDKLIPERVAKANRAVIESL